MKTLTVIALVFASSVNLLRREVFVSAAANKMEHSYFLVEYF